mgnify:CR=1 FL=1
MVDILKKYYEYCIQSSGYADRGYFVHGVIWSSACVRNYELCTRIPSFKILDDDLWISHWSRNRIICHSSDWIRGKRCIMQWE